MQACVTGKEMQEIEKVVIDDVGIPSLVLMERAALAVAAVVEEYAEVTSRIWVVCGRGNNGADGIAVARILHQKGYHVDVITIGNPEKSTEEYKIQKRIADNIGVSFISWELWDKDMVESEDWVIDGIFGIGLTREIKGEYALLIELVKGLSSDHILSIDIPSGISADSGAILGCALKAEHTVTFAYAKVGLYLGEGRIHSGEIRVADIGLGMKHVKGIRIIEDVDCRKIPQRKEDANKGTYGKLLLIAGSEGMSGAAYLSALAAYRTGAGLVKIITVEANREILQLQLPEALVQGYTESTMKQVVIEGCKWATTIVMGPGLSQRDYVLPLVKCVLKSAKASAVPTVLDSDALNTIAFNKELEVYYGNHVILTPHMKEMSRLTSQSVGSLKRNALSCAQMYCEKHGLTCILKDAVSVIANYDKISYLNISGNSALAKGGTGDILTGIVGGLLCLGMTIEEAAAFGSYIHGRAGSRASAAMGKHGVLASDLVQFLWGN